MALFVEGEVSKGILEVPKDASRYYITIPSSYLSEPYELIKGDKVQGEILKVRLDEEEFPEFEGKKIELIFGGGIIYDYLYISEKDWKEDFRDYGLVESGYVLELRLDEVIRHNGEVIKLYSKRDIKV